MPWADTVTIKMVGVSNADAKEMIHSMEKRQTALMMRGLIMDTPVRSTNNMISQLWTDITEEKEFQKERKRIREMQDRHFKEKGGEKE